MLSSVCSRMSSPFLTSSRFLPPVRMIFPEENIRTTILGSLIRYTSPGNCSGSYSIFSTLSVTTILLRLMDLPRSYEQTILVIATLGSLRVSIPASFNDLMMIASPSVSALLLRLPVSTILPDEKIRDAILGSLIRYTAPGNRFLLSSQFLTFSDNSTRSMESAMAPDATIFSIVKDSYFLSAIFYSMIFFDA